MNWGKSMLFVYLAFVAGILFMVVKAFGHDFDLVTEDYYAEELRFQNRIDAEKNALPFVDSVSIEVAENSIKLKFPAALAGMQEGKAYFYKASDASEDVHLALQPDATGIVEFGKEQFAKGFYTLKLSWVESGKEYFMQRNIYL